ncbi:MAG: AAA family ATPase [Candidatus Sulfotelmatobacter sp.]
MSPRRFPPPCCRARSEPRRPIPELRVSGFAPSSRAARQLMEPGVEAGTLQSFLARSAQSDSAPGGKHFYFVDESSLASTNQMREFLARLSASGRVLLIGDKRQH